MPFQLRSISPRSAKNCSHSAVAMKNPPFSSSHSFKYLHKSLQYQQTTWIKSNLMRSTAAHSLCARKWNAHPVLVLYTPSHLFGDSGMQYTLTRKIMAKLHFHFNVSECIIPSYLPVLYISEATRVSRSIPRILIYVFLFSCFCINLFLPRCEHRAECAKVMDRIVYNNAVT